MVTKRTYTKKETINKTVREKAKKAKPKTFWQKIKSWLVKIAS
jgi:hypothetical protein